MDATPIAPAEIIRRIVQANELRATQLTYYTARRHYHLDFHAHGRTMSADMHVQATYREGVGKTFEVIDESGSRILLDRVMKKLLETEQHESLQHQAALSPANYTLTYQTETEAYGERLYVFAIEPKVNNNLLYRGTIWVDAKDYAVVRIQGQPAVSPSFWIKSTHIHHVYAKNRQFWLPESNRSESKTRLGGTAVLTIDYGTYDFEKPGTLTVVGDTEVAVHDSQVHIDEAVRYSPRNRSATK